MRWIEDTITEAVDRSAGGDLVVEVDVRLLGDLEVRLEGRAVDIGHARQRGVLAALLVDAGRPVPAVDLIERVWADRAPQRARNVLSGYLSRLRRALPTNGDLSISRRGGGYVVVVDPPALDLHRFRSLVGRARTATDSVEAEHLLSRALQLWRGEALAGLDTPWADTVRHGLEAERLAAELDRYDLALDLGRHATVLGGLLTYARAYPTDERLIGQVMRALYRCGRQAEALERYEALRRRLADELGADPSPPLRELHRRILQADVRARHERGGGEAPAIPRADAALTGPGPAPPVPRQLPAPPRGFTGRRRELAQLHALLAPAPGRDAVAVVAVSGTPGVGKTALAVHWAHTVADRFPDGHLHVDLRGFDPRGAVVRPADAVRGFLEALGVAPQRIPADLDAQAALFRSLLAGRRVLVVLDNARDVAQVKPLLPGTPGCVTVITSRTELVGLAATEGAHLLPLDVLTDTEAYELLTHRLDPDQVRKEPEAVAEITSRCFGLPLALSIVGARATAKPDFPLAALADELREAGDELTPFAGGDATSDVREVFSWSYRTLGPDAATMFRRLGLHPGPDIGAPAAASLAGFPVARARILLTELARAHLVAEHSPGRFAFHDLLRAYANELATGLETATGRAAAVRRLLDHYVSTAHAAAVLVHPHRLGIDPVPASTDVTPEPIADRAHALAWFTAEGPALLAAVGHAAEAGLHRHTWQLAWAVASFLDRRGRWDELLVAQRAAVEATQRLPDRSAHAHARRLLARTYTRLGRHDDAYVELRRSLDLSTALGDRVGMATAHLGMEQILDRRDEPRPALDHARHALDLFTAERHRAGRAHALNAIGWLSTRLGDHEAALSSCREALAMHQEVGNRHGEAATWDSLGFAHHHVGYHREAVDCYERALALSRDLGDRTYEADVLGHLGDTHAAAGDHVQARRAWRRAATILDELGQPGAGRARAKLNASVRDAVSR